METGSTLLHRQAFDHADAGLALLSPQGEWLQVNAALAALAGQPPASLQGTRAHEAVFDGGIATGIARWLATPDHARPARVVLESDDGAFPAWRVVLAALPDAGGVLLQCTDIGAERRQRERERATAELQEHVAHGLSHELRAPLRGIAGFAARLDEAGLVAEAGKPDLERIRAAAARADDLVRALLEFLRVSRQPMREEPVDVSLLCEWVATDLQDAARDRAARITIAPGLWARGDERWLKVLLREVFDNAWKFSSGCEETRITVEGAVEDGRLRLAVSDRGCGFDMRYADKLFLPFQRLHGSNQGGGHGLGLAIARRVAECHGGSIRAESRPGQGSTFFIELPAASPGAGAEPGQ
ncbi:Bacteriophytochrome (light-regulated signal transduction histidine kinase) [Luteimonas sp. J16]|uniref:PAS domain-containing sensor histidine kinase n=1 Tax=Luteimonas sp. J16 TaxID=935283 RepID=UPI0004B7D4D7|nr:PAS domain-containing sensor histidine kinase [Luteimonas sp. J16]TWG89417.1 Bacteriophytochrome (light-regulated signal transduction histidine kinase) [Luteimonas sp. J16]